MTVGNIISIIPVISEHLKWHGTFLQVKNKKCVNKQVKAVQYFYVIGSFIFTCRVLHSSISHHW